MGNYPCVVERRLYSHVQQPMTLTDRAETIRSLNMPEILNAVPHRTFKTSERQCRANLEAAIYNLPQDKYDFLVGASAAKRCHLESTSTSRVVLPDPFLPNVDSSSDDNDDSLLFETVSDDCCHQSNV